MADIFDELNKQSELLIKQRFKSLLNRIELALCTNKTDQQWRSYFTELLDYEDYHLVVNAIQLKADLNEKDRLLHILDESQFYHVQIAENEDHKTLIQFN